MLRQKLDPYQEIVQGDGAGLHQQSCTHLPPNTGQTTCHSPSTSLHYISWLAGTAITESADVRTAESLAIFCKRLET